MKKTVVKIAAIVLLLSCNNNNTKTNAEEQKILNDVALQADSIIKAESLKSKNNQHINGDANEQALKEIRAERKVKEAIVTDAGVLYASVIDDGTRRTGYAEYLGQILQEHGSLIKKVKVVAFGSTDSPNKDNAYGILLGEYDCR